MKKLSYIYWIISGMLVLLSGHSLAEETILHYEAVPGTLHYQSEVKMESLVHTGNVNVSTNLELTSQLESQVTVHQQQLMFKLTFKDVDLDVYDRDVRVLDHDKRSVGATERSNLEKELKRLISYKWINLVFNQQGEVLEKYHSTSFDQISQIDLTRLADSFFIQFPERPLQIGDEWQESYYSMLPPYDQVKPFSSIIKYTYLGKDEQNGIKCDRVKVFLIHQEEGRLGADDDGITRINQIITGTLYFAIDGHYLVQSQLVNDLTMLVVMGESGAGGYRNFIRTRLEQTIELVEGENPNIVKLRLD